MHQDIVTVYMFEYQVVPPLKDMSQKAQNNHTDSLVKF